MRILRLATLSVIALVHCAMGQNRAAPASPAKTSASVDLTGYWVALITEDWRFRMVTPRKGDFQAVPINEQARTVANAWDPATDEAAGNQCKAYGAGAIMRSPTRLHFSWQDENTMRLDTDWGTQTRLFHFGPTPASAQRTWQGDSAASWQRPKSLKVTTTNVRAGYLRRNGVPYSENAIVTEFFDVGPLPGGGQVLLVTTIVDDPRYLLQPFIVTSQFKKEADGSKWDPTPCTVK
jgi:hypothetical protein